MTTKQRQVHPFKGGRKAVPTKRHKPVIWECILGTVYAANPAGEVKYFDYDWDGAREWAAITPDSDLRVAKMPRDRRYRYYGDAGPSVFQLILWAVR